MPSLAALLPSIRTLPAPGPFLRARPRLLFDIRALFRACAPIGHDIRPPFFAYFITPLYYYYTTASSIYFHDTDMFLYHAEPAAPSCLWSWLHKYSISPGAYAIWLY